MSGPETALSADDIVDIGEEHHQAGRLQEAESCYRQALEIDPAHPGALYYLAGIAYEDGRLQLAAQLSEELLRGEPNDAEAWHLLGMIALQEENLTRASECVKKALVIQPAYTQAHYSLGVLLNRQDDFNGALASFQRVIMLNPDCAEVYNSQGNTLQNLNRFDEALVNYDKAIAFIPYNPEAYYNRGNALRSLKRLDEALSSYDKAIALEPDYAEARHSRDSLLQNFKPMNEGASKLVGVEQVAPSYRTARAPTPVRAYKCPPPSGFESHYANYQYAPDRFIDKNIITIDEHEVRVLDRLSQPEVVVFENVLSAAECELLISLSRPKLQRSATYDRTSRVGEATVNAERTSEGTFFQREENTFIRAIEVRLARLMNVSCAHGEGLQILHYATGTEYVPHYDFFAPEDASSAALLQARGQRVATLVIYLNDVASGGETIFPEIDFAVQPRKGGGVYFSYCDEAGKLDRLTLHGGAPVTGGEKWVATKWVRQRAR